MAAVQKQPIVEMIETIVRQPLFDLGGRTISRRTKSASPKPWPAHEACNGCTPGRARGLRRHPDPKEAFFPDQDFRAKP